MKEHVCDHSCRCPECFGPLYYREPSTNIKGGHACVDPKCAWDQSTGVSKRKCYVEDCVGQACNGFILCYEHQHDAVDEFLDRYDIAHTPPGETPNLGARRIDLDD